MDTRIIAFSLKSSSLPFLHQVWVEGEGEGESGLEVPGKLNASALLNQFQYAMGAETVHPQATS